MYLLEGGVNIWNEYYKSGECDRKEILSRILDLDLHIINNIGSESD